ncbi:MAG: signal peptidase II [Thermodesulfovibrionales bacterium]
MKSKKIYFLISAAIIIFDQFTKQMIVNNIMPYEAIYVLPFFNIVNVANKGAAFGSMQFMGNPFFIVISLIAIAAVIYLLIKGIEDPLALSFILGGAIGNLIDRLRFGFVVDFLDVFIGRYHWPAFNVADSFLTIGIFLILLTNVLSFRKSASQSD